ncbi:MAG: alpha/beta hydrolase [Desulfosarcinaceae bacterium]|nr:alpha/beta hydrolase [Desulfosarcinaceae bacterium]
MRRRWGLAILVAALVGALLLGGCGLTRWAIHRWGEPQFMSYRIDARNLALCTTPRDQFAFTAEGIAAALERVGGSAVAARQPLILFIHGRGKHPDKAYGDHPEIGRDILAQMATEYRAAVLMLHWPSWLGPAGYPSLNARETGPHLARLFDALARYRAGRNRADRPSRIHLLVHSMGNQVLASYMAAYDHRFGEGPPLFDSLILNAPDVALADHRHWVDAIDFSDRIYILLNSGRDQLLKLSTYLLGTPRLGRQLQHADGRREPLAEKAVYLDLTAIGVNHDYFYGRERPAALVELYRRIFSGSAPPLETPGLTPGDLPRTYRLKRA